MKQSQPTPQNPFPRPPNPQQSTGYGYGYPQRQRYHYENPYNPYAGARQDLYARQDPFDQAYFKARQEEKRQTEQEFQQRQQHHAQKKQEFQQQHQRNFQQKFYEVPKQQKSAYQQFYATNNVRSEEKENPPKASVSSPKVQKMKSTNDDKWTRSKTGYAFQSGEKTPVERPATTSSPIDKPGSKTDPKASPSNVKEVKQEATTRTTRSKSSAKPASSPKSDTTSMASSSPHESPGNDPDDPIVVDPDEEDDQPDTTLDEFEDADDFDDESELLSANEEEKSDDAPNSESSKEPPKAPQFAFAKFSQSHLIPGDFTIKNSGGFGAAKPTAASIFHARPMKLRKDARRRVQSPPRATGPAARPPTKSRRANRSHIEAELKAEPIVVEDETETEETQKSQTPASTLGPKKGVHMEEVPDAEMEDVAPKMRDTAFTFDMKVPPFTQTDGNFDMHDVGASLGGPERPKQRPGLNKPEFVQAGSGKAELLSAPVNTRPGISFQIPRPQHKPPTNPFGPQKSPFSVFDEHSATREILHYPIPTVPAVLSAPSISEFESYSQRFKNYTEEFFQYREVVGNYLEQRRLADAKNGSALF
ncbi:hypothetical protein BABINDRAFT_163564, partial [Babjeviella inositovora NRRL Y-12698]